MFGTTIGVQPFLFPKGGLLLSEGKPSYTPPYLPKAKNLVRPRDGRVFHLPNL